MPKIKEQNQTPTYEEFMKTCNESENLNYDDLNTNTKSYGPGGPGGDENWWYGKSREFISTLKQCDSCSRTITGEEYSRNGGYCNSHKNRCQFESCPERVNNGYCYKHTFEEQTRIYKERWESERDRANQERNRANREQNRADSLQNNRPNITNQQYKQEKDGLQAQITELSKRPTAQQLKEANGKVSGLQTELEKVTRQRDGRPDIALYQWNNDYSQRPTRQQYDKLVREITELQTKRDNLQGQIKGLQNQLGVANTNLTAANNRANNLQEQVNNLNGQLTAKQQEIDNLQQRIGELEKQLNDYLSQDKYESFMEVTNK